MSIWFRPVAVEDLVAHSRNTLVEHLGIRLTEIGPDYLRGTLPVDRRTHQTMGILHGGAYMAFADTVGAIGAVMNLPPNTRTTTIESKTNFLGAAPVNTHVTAESTPLHRGKTTQVWQTMIRSEAGRLCAVVTQTQMVLPA